LSSGYYRAGLIKFQISNGPPSFVVKLPKTALFIDLIFQKN